MRVIVYVDGFNLYYRALKATSYKWLNIEILAKRLLDPSDTIELIRYFTARVSSRSTDIDAPRRQQAYLNVLANLPSVRIHYGNFLAKTKWRPIVHPKWTPPVSVEVHDTEEKGSDVNLASYLLLDGFQNLYDAALILSQDTDLCEPLRMVKSDLGKTLGLVVLDGREANRKLKRNSSFVRHLKHTDLASSQFSNPVMGRNGHMVHKPLSW